MSAREYRSSSLHRPSQILGYVADSKATDWASDTCLMQQKSRVSEYASGEYVADSEAIVRASDRHVPVQRI
jgi:hypothetical protein